MTDETTDPVAPEIAESVESEPEDDGCQKCHGTGYYYPDGANGVVPCLCAREALASIALVESQIPKRFRTASFDNFEAKDETAKLVVAACRDYAENFRTRKTAVRNGLALLGHKGAGKTHLTAAIALQAILGGFSVLFWNEADLFNEIRLSFNAESQICEGYLLEDCMRADLLVLDDIGCNRITPIVEDRVYAIVNGRYQQNKPLVISSNMSMKQIGEAYGERTQDRIIETCKPLACLWPSYRRSGGAA